MSLLQVVKVTVENGATLTSTGHLLQVELHYTLTVSRGQKATTNAVLTSQMKYKYLKITIKSLIILMRKTLKIQVELLT